MGVPIDPEVIVILERATKKLVRVQKIEDTDPIIRKTEAKLARQFRAQGKQFVGRLSRFRSLFDEAISRRDWEEAWDKTARDTNPGMEVTFHEALDEGWKKGASRVVGNMGLASSFALKNPRAVEWLKTNAATDVAGVGETTKGYIRTLMTKAVDEGWSYDRTAKTLIARFEQFAVGMPQAHIDSRAHLIAVTESAKAYEVGNAQVVGDMMSQGVPMVKSWLTVGDDRVDPDCEDNEGQGWIPAEDAFATGDDQPPAHPACRCSTAYSVDPTWAGVDIGPGITKNPSAPQEPGTYDSMVDPSAKAAV